MAKLSQLSHFSPHPSSYIEVNKSMSQHVAEDNTYKQGASSLAPPTPSGNNSLQPKVPNMTPPIPAQAAPTLSVKLKHKLIRRRVGLGKAVLLTPKSSS
jgi:hypothetical protein